MKQTILFLDAGGVLFDAKSAPEERIAFVLRARGFSQEVIAHTVAAAEAAYEAAKSSGWLSTWTQEHDVWTHYYTTLAEILGTGQDDLAAELFHLCHFVNHCELFSEVRPALEQLQTAYRLGVISNALPSMDWVFDRLDIRHYFERIVLSAHTGCAKPDERIYHYALDAMNCAPQDAIFVDDKLENVEAARKLGMWGLHLTRGGESTGDARDLAELQRQLMSSDVWKP